MLVLRIRRTCTVCPQIQIVDPQRPGALARSLRNGQLVRPASTASTFLFLGLTLPSNQNARSPKETPQSSDLSCRVPFPCKSQGLDGKGQFKGLLHLRFRFFVVSSGEAIPSCSRLFAAGSYLLPFVSHRWPLESILETSVLFSKGLGLGVRRMMVFSLIFDLLFSSKPEPLERAEMSPSSSRYAILYHIPTRFQR